jgi:hypothetical protein
MTLVLMQKNGEADIRVDSSNVTAHEALGWHRAKISISADGQSLVIPYGTYIDVVDGALKLDSVQVLSSAAELNALNTDEDMVATVHYQITPAAESAVSVMAATALSLAGVNRNSGITPPDVPRTVIVKGNVSGITAQVGITGTNIAGAVIEDILDLEGTAEVESIMAFKTVTQVAFPGYTHAPVAQVETATVVGTVSGSGNATVIVTAAGMAGTPKTISVAVLENDTASDVAEKIRTALGLDAAVIALFNVTGATDKVILTRKTPAANDTSLNISIDNGTCAGLTTAGSSANTTAGVPYDTVSVGVGKKFGLPHIIGNASLLEEKLFDGADDNGTLAVDADELEKNLYSLAGTPNGLKVLDLYYLA